MLANAIVWIINAAMSVYFVGVTAKRYLEKKTRATLYLLVLFLCFIFANLGSAFDAFFKISLGGAQYGYAVALLCLGIGSIAILFFALDVFLGKEITPRIKMARLIFSVCDLAVCLWGSALLFTRQPNPTLVLALNLILCFSAYLTIGLKALKLSKRIDDTFYRRSIRFIGVFALTMLIMFVFYILDSTEAQIAQNPALEGETIASFLATISYTVAILLCYQGFVRPMVKPAVEQR